MTIIRGLFYSFGQAGANFVIQFASSIILARLLLPSEIGIFAVAVSFTVVLHALRDFGVGRYLIQERQLTSDKIRTVFGVALLVAWMLAALIFFGRSTVAEFYSEPVLENILAIFAINFILLPIGQPAFVLLRRERRYSRVAAINVASAFTGASVSIIFAALHFGPISLAYGSLAGSSVTVVLALISRPEHLLLLPSLREWRNVCAFGGLASAGTVITQLGMQAPELLMGRFLGFSAVGLYSKGVSLAKIFEDLFVGAVAWVTGAEYGSRHRSDESFADLVLKTTDFTLLFGWPALIFLAVNAETVIWLLFGNNWLAAAPVVVALCVSRGTHLLVSQAPAIYEGTGAVGLQLRNEVLLQFASVSLLIVAIPYGLEAVAWSRVALGLAVVTIHLSVFRQFVGVDLGMILAATWRSMLISGVFAFILAGLNFFARAEQGKDLVFLAMKSVIMGVVYIILVALFKPAALTALRAILQNMMPANRQNKAQ